MLLSAICKGKPALLIIFIVVFAVHTGIAQSAKEDSIKAVVRAETTSYYGKDADGWPATWAHDATDTRTFVSSNSFITYIGWEKFGPDDVKYLKGNPKSIPTNFSIENFIIHSDETVAWVEYDQITTYPGGDTTILHSKEQRVLAKQNGKWLIVSQVTFLTDTYGNNSLQTIENNLNNSGYALMAKERLQNAIEVFQLNTKLFPKSWNVFDSLGEAYAKAGNKKLAIENYQKSLVLNPKNDDGKKALETLMKK